MEQNLETRIRNVVGIIIEQANAVHSADLALVERSRRRLAKQKKDLDAVMNARAVHAALTSPPLN